MERIAASLWLLATLATLATGVGPASADEGGPSPAEAEAEQVRIVPAVRAGRVTQVVIPSPGAVVVIPVHPQQLTTVLIPDGFWNIQAKQNRLFRTTARDNRLRIFPKLRAPVGAQRSVKLVGLAEASLVFEVVAKPSLAADVVEVLFEWEQERHEAALEAMEDRVRGQLRAEYERREAKLRAEYERREAEYAQRLARHEERSLHGFAGSIQTTAGPIDKTLRLDRDVLRFHFPMISYGGEEGLLTVRVTNQGVYPVPVEAIEVQDVAGTDYTRTVQVAGREPGDVGGVLAPGQTLTASVVFRDPARLENGMVFSLGRGGGVSPIKVSFGAEVLSDHPNKDRKSIVLSGGGGVFQFDDDGGDSAVVGAWSIGGHFIYGAGIHWSVDVGLSGLMSGEAELAGTTRSERSYRLHGGARYQFGEDGWIPFARVGVGGALVVEAEDGASSLDLRGFVQAGGGVTRWLDDSFVLGAEALLEFPFGSSGDVTGIVSVHVGVAWDGYGF